MVGLSHGPKCLRASHFPGKFTVGPGCAVRDATQSFPTPDLKCGSSQIQWQGKFAQFATKICRELFFTCPQVFRRFHPHLVLTCYGNTAIKQELIHAFFRGCQQQRTYWRLHHCIEDFFRFRHGENISSKRLVEKFKPYNTSLAILIYSNTAAINRGGCVVEKWASQRFQDLILLLRNGKFFGGLKTFSSLRGSWVPVVHQS